MSPFALAVMSFTCSVGEDECALPDILKSISGTEMLRLYKQQLDCDRNSKGRSDFTGRPATGCREVAKQTGASPLFRPSDT